jgi:hypothetical protein
VPLEHEATPWAGASQPWAHAPQLAGSLVVFAHTAPHGSNPALHSMSQLPNAQLAEPFEGAAQLTPQPPQASGFCAKSTQAPSQFSRPREQAPAHAP